MARVIAIANQKGGVGKTTTAVNLAASLAVAEQRTLLIDGDPQGNATSGIGLEGEKVKLTVYDALINKVPLDEIILRSIQFAHLDVAPATPDLAGAEIELIDRPRRELAMREAIAPVLSRYDYVLIDCPPSLGLITVNMLAAADSILIPLQCEYYALEGLSQLLNTVHMMQRGVNPDSQHRRRRAHHVRRAPQSLPPGRHRRARVLRRQGLRDDGPAQRPPRRGAELRQADHPLRRRLRRRSGLHGDLP